MRSSARLVLALCAVAAALAAGAQQPASEKLAESNANARHVRAVRATGPIRIDGLLDESAWAVAAVVDGLRQLDPREGAPASEPTEVRILYDDRNLYFAIRAWDSEPSRINARELNRDASFANDDKIEILLDTYHDRRNAYRFAVNPLGTQQDALITDEGRDVNLSWDSAWLSAGRLEPDGFTVEIALPLTTLRYRQGAPAWGLNVARIIRRKNEEALWTSWQREFGLERVSQAGELTGLDELRRRRLLEFRPYITGGWRQGVPQVAEPGFDAGLRATGGLEVARLGLTSSLTAELTVNPDFGQVEVDQQVINLTRFSVFLPEKRDFFLENAGIFLFGVEQASQLFFSRRVGLTEDGSPFPIDYGLKVTGKAGRFNLGFLQVQTRELGDPAAGGIPRQHFTVARVKRDLLRRSYLGAIFVNRQGGVAAAYNRGAGLDAEFHLTDYLRVRTFLMGTATPGVGSGYLSFRVNPRYETDRWRLIGTFEDTGENFNPEVGFVERRGIRQYFAQGAWKPRPSFLPFVRQMEFVAQWEYYENRVTGRLDTRQIEFWWGTRFRNSGEFLIGPLEESTDVLLQPFEIRPGIVIPPGAYRFNRPWVAFSTDSSRRVVLNGDYQGGDFYTGRRHQASASVIFRPNPHIAVELSDTYNRVRLPQGDFSTNLFGGRASYNFSRRLLTNAFVQLNSAARLSTVNVRLRYIFRPYSDFFAIYTSNTGRGVAQPSHQVQLKVAYYFSR